MVHGRLYVYWYDRCLIVDSRRIGAIIIWFIDRKYIGIIVVRFRQQYSASIKW